MKRLPIGVWSIAAIAFVVASGSGVAAEKVRMAYVSPSVSLSLPWMAKETGILAMEDVDADVKLITGDPRLDQSLIASDVDIAFAMIAAMRRARMRGDEVAILGHA